MTTDDQQREFFQPRVARRSFLYMLGAFSLGRFSLPVGDASASASETPRDQSAELTDVERDEIRSLLSLPVKSKGGRVMVWVEHPTDDGRDCVRICILDNEQDRQEAERFYEMAHWRSWRTDGELRTMLRDAGPWLIRRNWLGAFHFLNTTDEALLFGPDWENQLTLTDDPDYAIRMSSAEAFEIARKLAEQHSEEGLAYYYEPVLPSEALEDRRLGVSESG